MRRRPPASPSAEQMIRDYLVRVSAAAQKVLPKGDRLLFVGRTRAAIEAQVGPIASAESEDVVTALNRLGDPEELARRERERLTKARRSGAEATVLWKPDKRGRRSARPQPQPQPSPPSRSGSAGRPAGKPRPWPGEPAGAEPAATPAAAQPASAQPTAAQPAGQQADQGPAPGSGGLSGDGTPADEGLPTGGSRPADTASTTQPLSIVPGMQTRDSDEPPPDTRRLGVPEPLTEAWAFVRKQPLEAATLLLLGVGGLLYPFPLWLVAGIVSVKSQRWDRRDKWVVFAGPLLFTAAALFVMGVTGQGNFFTAFGHATHHFGLLLRVGCLLCTGYLVWRLRRGPRLPPWQRLR
jgi:hypothetical protein